MRREASEEGQCECRFCRDCLSTLSNSGFHVSAARSYCLHLGSMQPVHEHVTTARVAVMLL